MRTTRGREDGEDREREGGERKEGKIGNVKMVKKDKDE